MPILPLSHSGGVTQYVLAVGFAFVAWVYFQYFR